MLLIGNFVYDKNYKSKFIYHYKFNNFIQMITDDNFLRILDKIRTQETLNFKKQQPRKQSRRVSFIDQPNVNLNKQENVDLTKFFHTKVLIISNVNLILSLMEIFLGLFLALCKYDEDFSCYIAYAVLTLVTFA
jgi:hypothetical protein